MCAQGKRVIVRALVDSLSKGGSREVAFCVVRNNDCSRAASSLRSNILERIESFLRMPSDSNISYVVVVSLHSSIDGETAESPGAAKTLTKSTHAI